MSKAAMYKTAKVIFKGDENYGRFFKVVGHIGENSFGLLVDGKILIYSKCALSLCL